jgi:AraC-like DNA-binding protein
MPFDRTTHFESHDMALREIVLTKACPEWSEAYRVNSPRLLMPLCQSANILWPEQKASSALLDATTAASLHERERYRLRQPYVAIRYMSLEMELAESLTGIHRVQLHHHVRLWSLRKQCNEQMNMLAVQERLIALVLEITQASPVATERASLHTSAQKICARAREVMTAQYVQNLSLEEIAKAACCSPFHLARIYPSYQGFSLHQHRMLLRIAEAMQRMAQGENDLTQLGLSLGFASHSHFSHVFKQKLALTPSAFRSLSARQVRKNLIATKP